MIRFCSTPSTVLVPTTKHCLQLDPIPESFVLRSTTSQTSLSQMLIRKNVPASEIRWVIWPPYPDSVTALSTLREHFVLGALTNMDNGSFEKTHALLGNCFEIRRDG